MPIPHFLHRILAAVAMRKAQLLAVGTSFLTTLRESKGSRVVAFGLVALAVFFFLPSFLRLFDPTAGGFTPDTVGAAALGAFHYFAALSMAYVSWRWLFPNLYRYAVDCMEGKLLENLTDALTARFEDACKHAFKPADASRYKPDLLVQATELDLKAAAERRHIAQLQFLIRCVRFVFSLLPFVLFLVLANHALTAALTAVPSAAPGL